MTTGYSTNKLTTARPTHYGHCFYLPRWRRHRHFLVELRLAVCRAKAEPPSFLPSFLFFPSFLRPPFLPFFLPLPLPPFLSSSSFLPSFLPSFFPLLSFLPSSPLPSFLPSSPPPSLPFFLFLPSFLPSFLFPPSSLPPSFSPSLKR